MKTVIPKKIISKESVENKQNRVMTEDEMIDEASEESFPASDPPGFRSKSNNDKILHESDKPYAN